MGLEQIYQQIDIYSDTSLKNLHVDLYRELEREANPRVKLDLALVLMGVDSEQRTRISQTGATRDEQLLAHVAA